MLIQDSLVDSKLLQLAEKEHALLGFLCDDFSTDDRVTKLFTKGSHNRSLSVTYIVQNLFGKNKEQRTISLNSHYLVVFKNPRDASQVTYLAKHMYPGKTKYLQEAFKEATSIPHGYLLIDLRQETPDHLRLRTRVFPDQAQVVHVKK